MTKQDEIAALRRRIRVRVAGRSTATVLHAMGYKRITPERRARLARVLDDELLGMEAGGFDFRFDARAFVNALCCALDMPPADYVNALDALVRVAENRRRFAPYIRVETDFVRRNQPLFVLALLERKRCVDLPRQIRDAAPVAQIRWAGELVAAHYRANDGHLDAWGRITRYRFFYAPGARAVFDTTGRVVSVGPANDGEPVAGNASLSVARKDMTQVVG